MDSKSRYEHAGYVTWSGLCAMYIYIVHIRLIKITLSVRIWLYFCTLFHHQHMLYIYGCLKPNIILPTCVFTGRWQHGTFWIRRDIYQMLLSYHDISGITHWLSDATWGDHTNEWRNGHARTPINCVDNIASLDGLMWLQSGTQLPIYVPVWKTITEHMFYFFFRYVCLCWERRCNIFQNGINMLCFTIPSIMYVGDFHFCRHSLLQDALMVTLWSNKRCRQSLLQWGCQATVISNHLNGDCGPIKYTNLYGNYVPRHHLTLMLSLRFLSWVVRQVNILAYFMPHSAHSTGVCH